MKREIASLIRALDSLENRFRGRDITEPEEAKAIRASLSHLTVTVHLALRYREPEPLTVKEAQEKLLPPFDEIAEQLPPWGDFTPEPVIFTRQGAIPFSKAPEITRKMHENLEKYRKERHRRLD